MSDYKLIQGDCLDVLRTMPSESVQCCVTSPPYFGLRDYGVDGQVGLEPTPAEYVAKLVDVFAEVWRVLRGDGTLWLNLGDSYVANRGNTAEKPGHDNKAVHSDFATRTWKIPGKPKDLLGIPWRVAFALQDFGWYLRSDIIWHKPNPMPESVTDRPTKSHEYFFLLTKSERYYYDAEAIAEDSVYKPGGSHADVKQGGFHDKGAIPGSGQRSFRAIRETRNKRSVWSVNTSQYSAAHFATFPPKLIEPCILAGSKPGDVVLDPFNGSGTTGAVALEHGRNYIGIELNPAYIELAHDRINGTQPRLILETAM